MKDRKDRNNKFNSEIKIEFPLEAMFIDFGLNHLGNEFCIYVNHLPSLARAEKKAFIEFRASFFL